MSEITGVIAQISALTFILTSMLAMGLSLTVKQIIDPLRNVKVVLLALLGNFVLRPGLPDHLRDSLGQWLENRPDHCWRSSRCTFLAQAGAGCQR